MKSETPAPTDELDLVKVYIWGMFAMTLILGGVLWWQHSERENTEKLVRTARSTLVDFAEGKQEIEAMLNVYATNKEDEARRRPSTWFSRVWQRKRIPDASIRLESWEEKKSSKEGYVESKIRMKFDGKAPLTRSQIGSFIHEVERASTRLRVIELKVSRAGRNEEFDKDEWQGQVVIGYRTPDLRD